MEKKAEIELINSYELWLLELKDKAPELLGANYSNPYYTSIPEHWFETAGPRIMVVGEEGFGKWGMGKCGEPSAIPEEIDKIQHLNYTYLREQIQQDEGELNNSSVWRRFRRIAEHGVCCWTNIDKIHYLSKEKCSLTPSKRKLLHSVNTRVLAK